MRQLVRQHLRFFLLVTLAALGLRLLFIFRFPGVTTDSFVYGDIAKNWLQHGIYGLSGTDEISATYIRLPGYPAFLAAAFAVFGMEHYRAVLILQMFVDVGTCFLIADMARRLVSAKAARAAFLLAALCPFLASYSAAALTETLEIFFTALALDFAVAALTSISGLLPWIGCGAAIAGAILLRPDGGLLLVAIEFYLLIILARVWLGRSSKSNTRRGRPRPTVILFRIRFGPAWYWHSFHWRHWCLGPCEICTRCIAFNRLHHAMQMKWTNLSRRVQSLG